MPDILECDDECQIEFEYQDDNVVAIKAKVGHAVRMTLYARTNELLDVLRSEPDAPMSALEHLDASLECLDDVPRRPRDRTMARTKIHEAIMWLERN